MAVSDVKAFFMNDLVSRLKSNPDKAKKIGGVYGFDVTGAQAGKFLVDLNNAEVKEGTVDGADVTISLSDEVMLQILNRELNEMQAFTQGKLRVSGNVMAALKLKEVLDPSGW